MIKIGKIYNEDHLETMARMPDKCIDFIITSPPYGELREYNGYVFDYTKTIPELCRVIKDGSVIVWVVGDETKNGSESGDSFRQALLFMDCGMKLHDTMLYSKRGSMFAESKRYNQQFEYMFIFVRDKLNVFNPIFDRINIDFGRKKSTATYRNNNGTIPKFTQRSNIWEYSPGYMKSSVDKVAFKHPAIFPERLAVDHIVSWTNENDLIYDPMCGSGTVPKMAIEYNRRWVASEVSDEYCDLAQKRISKYQNQLKIF